MYLYSAKGNQSRDPVFDASGSTASASLPQLVLPERKSCSFLILQNTSDAVLWIEIGGARATCTISNGAVSGFTITNAGFNYTYPPLVYFLGGGAGGISGQLGAGLPGYPAPGFAASPPIPTEPPYYHPAHATTVLTSGAVTSFVLSDPGAGYVAAPLIFLQNDPRDPYGCADPSVNSGSGIQLGSSGGSIYFNGTFMTTDAIAIFGASTGLGFTCKWAP